MRSGRGLFSELSACHDWKGIVAAGFHGVVLFSLGHLMIKSINGVSIVTGCLKRQGSQEASLVRSQYGSDNHKK